MVFFTCNGCGESLKKGQVEKHTSICRNCQCLSCIDCGKDFWGEDYKTHLKCISEDQKYGGKAFEAKANKGDVKQQLWIQRIHEVMNKPNISPNIKNILNQISTYDNIPRKKAKFQNWMKNSLKIHNQAVQDQVWEIFSEATSTAKAGKNATKPANTATTEEISQPSETVEETKKKSKRERKEERQKKNKKEKKELSSEEHMENGTKKKSKKRKMEDEAQDSDDEDRTDKKKKKKKNCENDGENLQENGEEEPRARKKQKHEELQEEDVENSMDGNDEENIANKGKFNWKGTIKALLKQAPDHELPIKKLRKKVIAQYYTVSSAQHKSEEDVLATFNKKIHSNPKFRVLKERVKLMN